MPALADHTCVVTGANTGIGLATAKELAALGAHVVLACRSRPKTEAAMDEIRAATPKARLSFLELDLAELSAVRRAADELLREHPSVDLLINNAGLAGQRGETKDGFELAFGVNHLGHYLFTRLVLDAVSASPAPRIVHVSSNSHYSAKGIDFEAVRRPTKTVTGLKEYGVSKLCNVLFSAELTRVLGKDSPIKNYSLHPGAVASDVWRRIPWPVRPIMKRFMLTNEEGARTTLHCATSSEAASQTGLYYDDCKVRRPSRAAQDEALAAELWAKSAEWVGLDP
ncbi:MAG: SDR family oxidoreductase [Polyangiaceae bacterium]|nr:SDR family oxidoreductase [Polyangiaceae bacterium]